MWGMCRDFETPAPLLNVSVEPSIHIAQHQQINQWSKTPLNLRATSENVFTIDRERKLPLGIVLHAPIYALIQFPSDFCGLEGKTYIMVYTLRKKFPRFRVTGLKFTFDIAYRSYHI